MGVFTVGRQVALEIDMPGWWLANASVDMDFRRGLYYDSSTANPRAATDFLSCTRASVGYAKTSTGTLTSFATNTLRLTDLGLLVEGSSTNNALRSQELGNAVYSNNSINIGTDAVVAPDGTTTADTLIGNFSGSGSFFYGQQLSGGVAGPLAVSVWAKKVNNNYFWLSNWSATNVWATAVFDLNLGVIGQTAGGSSGGTVLGSSIEAYANGWYRCIMIANASTASACAAEFAPADAATGNTFDTLGRAQSTNSVGNTSHAVWGLQIEQASFPSSYIPTTSAAATRAADNITNSGSLQTVINNATASLVAQTDNGLVAGAAANIVDSNGTNLLGFNVSNNALASITATLATGNAGNRTTQDKLGLAWNASGRSLVLNGGTVATDATTQTPLATQHTGSSGSANFAYAYVERLSAWTTKLADATLQGFTV